MLDTQILFIFPSALSIQSFLTATLFGVDFWLALTVSLSLGIGLAVLMFIGLYFTGRASSKAYREEEHAFTEHAASQGWNMEDYQKVKYRIKHRIERHPGISFEELYDRFGDDTDPRLNRDNFEETLTHIGFYSVYRFGHDADGNWWRLDNKEVLRRYKVYQSMLKNKYPVIVT